MRICLLAVAAIVPAVASAQSCPSYVGQTVTPMTFDAAATKLAAMPKIKGEYETTAAFEARTAGAMGGTSGVMMVGYRPDPKYLTYDADAGKLNVVTYAFKNTNTDYTRVFGYGSPYQDKVKFSSFGNRDIVLAEAEAATGSYVGQNAYGATRRIYKKTRVVRSIFADASDRIGEDDFWAKADDSDKLNPVLERISMSVPDAQALKAGARAVAVFAPKWPFYAEGVDQGEGQMDTQEEVRQINHVIVADIKCVLLTTSAGHVVGSYEVR